MLCGTRAVLGSNLDWKILYDFNNLFIASSNIDIQRQEDESPIRVCAWRNWGTRRNSLRTAQQSQGQLLFQVSPLCACQHISCTRYFCSKPSCPHACVPQWAASLFCGTPSLAFSERSCLVWRSVSCMYSQLFKQKGTGSFLVWL